MVYYFVIGADGQRYGPADVDTLVQWANQGRLIAETTLIERGTDRQLRADSITAVAVAFQRLAGQGPQPVSVERFPESSREAPTMTQTPLRPPPPPPPPPSASPLEPLGARRTQFSSRSRVVAGLLGLFFGGLGIHRFYLGYRGLGLLMLLISVLSMRTTRGLGCGLIHMWGAIEGIIILCGGFSDADGRPLRD